MPQSFFASPWAATSRRRIHTWLVRQPQIFYFESVAVAFRMEVMVLGGVGAGGYPVGLDRFRVSVQMQHVAVGAAVALGIPEKVGALTL